MFITDAPPDPPTTVTTASTPQDRTNRDRIEQVTKAMLSLCADLEQRLAAVEHQLTEIEHRLEALRG